MYPIFWERAIYTELTLSGVGSQLKAIHMLGKTAAESLYSCTVLSILSLHSSL